MKDKINMKRRYFLKRLFKTYVAIVVTPLVLKEIFEEKPPYVEYGNINIGLSNEDNEAEYKVFYNENDVGIIVLEKGICINNFHPTDKHKININYE